MDDDEWMSALGSMVQSNAETLDPQLLNIVVTFAKTGRDQMESVLNAILARLQERNSRSRYKAILLLNGFFVQSAFCRQWLAPVLVDVYNLCLGGPKHEQLPPPKPFSRLLVMKSRSVFEQWIQKFEKSVPQLIFGRKYLFDHWGIEIPTGSNHRGLGGNGQVSDSDRAEEIALVGNVVSSRFFRMRSTFGDLYSSWSSRKMQFMEMCLLASSAISSARILTERILSNPLKPKSSTTKSFPNSINPLNSTTSNPSRLNSLLDEADDDDDDEIKSNDEALRLFEAQLEDSIVNLRSEYLRPLETIMRDCRILMTDYPSAEVTGKIFLRQLRELWKEIDKIFAQCKDLKMDCQNKYRSRHLEFAKSLKRKKEPVHSTEINRSGIKIGNGNETGDDDDNDNNDDDIIIHPKRMNSNSGLSSLIDDNDDDDEFENVDI